MKWPGPTVSVAMMMLFSPGVMVRDWLEGGSRVTTARPRRSMKNLLRGGFGIRDQRRLMWERGRQRRGGMGRWEMGDGVLSGEIISKGRSVSFFARDSNSS